MYAGMLTNWEGGCYALLTVQMSLKWIFDLDSKTGNVSALFCGPVELLKHFPPERLAGSSGTLALHIRLRVPWLSSRECYLFKPGDPKCLCN